MGQYINWDNLRPDLKEDLSHLVQDIKRRIRGIASAGFLSFSVLEWRDHLAWLATRDREAALAYWRTHFAGENF